MKLPAILKRDTKADLDSIHAQIRAGEGRLSELTEQHDAVLAGDDTIASARAIKRDMGEESANLEELHGRREKLVTRLAGEKAELDKQAYSDAVDKIAAALPRRLAAAKAVERALENLASATKEFMASSADAMDPWPSNVEWPNVSAFHLTVARCGELIQRTFAPERGLMDRRRRLESFDYLKFACDADRYGFSAAEKEAHAQFLDDLRHAHDPLPAEDESEPENPDEEEAA